MNVLPPKEIEELELYARVARKTIRKRAELEHARVDREASAARVELAAWLERERDRIVRGPRRRRRLWKYL